MNQVLEARRAANTADITLESGLEITGTLPRIRDCLMGGDIPLPVLAELEGSVAAGATPQLTPEQMQAVGAFNDNLVMAFVKAIEGEPADLTPEDMGLFSEEEYNEIVLYASRAKPLPGKD
jgi:hypothetical protein